MHLLRWSRPIVILQWVLAVALPAFVFFGRGLVGAGLGWTAVIGIFYGPVLLLALLVPPLIAIFDREGRRAGVLRRNYTVATLTLWAALLLAGLTIPDAGDSDVMASALSAWTGLSAGASEGIFVASAALAALAWLAAAVTAVIGVVRGRSVAV